MVLYICMLKPCNSAMYKEEDARRGRDGRGRKRDELRTAFIDTTV